jgi:hypothetical protein
MTVTPVVRRTLVLLVAATLVVVGAVATGVTELAPREAPHPVTGPEHAPGEEGGH